MKLKEKILVDLKNAMKSGDTLKRDVLRVLDSNIKNAEIEKKKREDGLSDEEVVEIIKRLVKQHKDSIEQYKNGGRNDLAEKEEQEAEILSSYLPEQMSEKEIERIVDEKIEEMGTADKSSMGKIMGAVMSQLKGKADGDIVKNIVEKKLK